MGQQYIVRKIPESLLLVQVEKIEKVFLAVSDTIDCWIEQRQMDNEIPTYSLNYVDTNKMEEKRIELEKSVYVQLLRNNKKIPLYIERKTYRKRDQIIIIDCYDEDLKCLMIARIEDGWREESEKTSINDWIEREITNNHEYRDSHLFSYVQ